MLLYFLMSYVLYVVFHSFLILILVFIRTTISLINLFIYFTVIVYCLILGTFILVKLKWPTG